MKKNYSKKLTACLAVVAVLLLAAFAAPAQEQKKESSKDEKSPPDGKPGKMTRIVIIKDENGKTVKMDTTIMGDGVFAFDEAGFGKSFEFEFPELPELAELPELPEMPEIKIFGDSGYAFFFHDKKMTGEEKQKWKSDMKRAKEEMKKALEEMKSVDKEELKEEMKQVEKELEKLREELRELDNDNKKEKGDKKLMMYRMKSPGKDAEPSMRKCVVMLNDEGNNLQMKKCIRVKCDTLAQTGKTVIWIHDDEDRKDNENGETPQKENVAQPAEAKDVITSEAPFETIGRTAETTSSKLEPEDLQFFPNPGNGKFTLNFSLNTPGAANIRLLDAGGKELVNETVDSFPGSYSKQFDVSGKAKGTYLLMISQNGKWKHEKLVVR